jgi:hypothetical protein
MAAHVWLELVQPLVWHFTTIRHALLGGVALAILGFGPGEFGVGWAILGLIVSRSVRKSRSRT